MTLRKRIEEKIADLDHRIRDLETEIDDLDAVSLRYKMLKNALQHLIEPKASAKKTAKPKRPKAKAGPRKAPVRDWQKKALELLRKDPGGRRAQDIAKACGVVKSVVYKWLKTEMAAGRIVKDAQFYALAPPKGAEGVRVGWAMPSQPVCACGLGMEATARAWRGSWWLGWQCESGHRGNDIMPPYADMADVPADALQILGFKVISD